MDLQTIWGRELQPTLPPSLIWRVYIHYGGHKMKSEKSWYRCVTREEMVLLVAVGFDYMNYRADKYNNGNITYFFERTEKLDEFLRMRQLLKC